MHGHQIKSLENAIKNISSLKRDFIDYLILGHYHGSSEIPAGENTIYAMHGHQIKSLENAIKNISSLKRDFIDYLILGHYHGSSEIPAGESVCNDTEVLVSPSFVGSDPYSDSLFKGSKASVKIYGFDEIYGHTESYKIILN